MKRGRPSKIEETAEKQGKTPLQFVEEVITGRRPVIHVAAEMGIDPSAFYKYLYRRGRTIKKRISLSHSSKTF